MLMEEVLTNFAQPVDIRHESFIDRSVSSGPELDVLVGELGFGSHLRIQKARFTS